MGNEFNDLYGQLYSQLLRRAAFQLRRFPAASLSPASLVHEAWARLAKTPEVGGFPTAHFKAIAARQMRQILIDAARKRQALRRGGAQQFRITLNTDVGAQASSLDQLLDIDAAIKELGSKKARLEPIAELRYFAGCTGREIAEQVGMSEAAVDRDLRFIREELVRRVGPGHG